ncbi:hypothetical protein BGX38DRAFT_44452 [Terfezia claveryi]|nr:hypothetical protein BGX38DRAFT_44452 [Terfezia claveryi]
MAGLVAMLLYPYAARRFYHVGMYVTWYACTARKPRSTAAVNSAPSHPPPHHHHPTTWSLEKGQNLRPGSKKKKKKNLTEKWGSSRDKNHYRYGLQLQLQLGDLWTLDNFRRSLRYFCPRASELRSNQTTPTLDREQDPIRTKLLFQFFLTNHR